MVIRHRNIAAMMRPPVQTSGIILEDNFQSGAEGAPLIGRATPIGGFVYEAGEQTPWSPYNVSPATQYWNDGVKDQLGLAIAASSSASDTRVSHYLPGVFQTNRYRVECDSIVYNGSTTTLYTDTSICVQSAPTFASDNQIRVYLYLGNTTSYSWLVNVFKNGANVEIDRGDLPLVTSRIQTAHVVIERVDDSLFISIDGTVITSGTGYANNMPDTTETGLVIYSRARNVPGRLIGSIKVTAL